MKSLMDFIKDLLGASTLTEVTSCGNNACGNSHTKSNG